MGDWKREGGERNLRWNWTLPNFGCGVRGALEMEPWHRGEEDGPVVKVNLIARHSLLASQPMLLLLLLFDSCRRYAEQKKGGKDGKREGMTEGKKKWDAG